MLRRQGIKKIKLIPEGRLSAINPKIYISAGVILLLLSVLAVCFLLIGNRPYELEYSIRTYSATEKEIQVDLNVSKLHYRDKLDLYKGGVKDSNAECYDYKSSRIPFQEKDDIVEIDCRNLNSIKFSYRVKLGSIEKHGHSGGVYDDLLVFDGEHALVLPEVAFDPKDSEVEKNIGKIAISYNVPDDWTCVIPFPKDLGKKRARPETLLSNPTWSDIYDLTKACYAFGRFRKYKIRKDNGSLDLFVDPAYKPDITDEVKQGTNSLYEYYNGLFDGEAPALSVVLLRKDNSDGQYISCGESKTSGSTFDPGIARDWELMGHRFFHSFFDSTVRTPVFHYAPRVWFNEGMATYYVKICLWTVYQQPSKKNRLGCK